MIDWVFLIITGAVAYHSLTHRNEDGENDIGHMLFGSIAMLFFMRVLLVDILKSPSSKKKARGQLPN